MDFYVWEVASNRYEASAQIAERVEAIQRLYAEAVLLAKEYDLCVDIAMELPDEAKGGHNRDEYVHWSASASHC